jgi:hypothetical protein
MNHDSVRVRINLKPNANKNTTKAEMKGLIDDDLTNYYVNQRIHTKFFETLKQHKEEIRASLNFV